MPVIKSLAFKYYIYIVLIPSKTDSAPVRGDGYEPGSSKFRPRANAETLHSACKQEMVVVVSVVGSSEKFLYGMVRSQKLLFWCPFIIQLLPVLLLSTCVIQHGYMALNNIP